ncbi:aldo/keto reductase [Amnibacterium sp.]|uniref:aldo/keto reductase n=1 Tax=Amnibacterium sp. TaxID=1872496 RepID=UPI002636A9F2|nr:aldo/keto reductase [Amnibacterium sp.]MCU1473008.1 alcohol dehydrogenase [Amnibacterium sp.]
MEYTRLGRTGLVVSRIAMGCMSFGDPTRGLHTWTLDEDASQPFFRQAVELGVTLWDTANTYQQGSSEEFVGRGIRRYSRREDIVLATKVYGRMHPGPGGGGLSRKAIIEQVDASLARLGTEYIDLYQIHRFDPEAPVEETMETLHDVVKAGKVRYLGASSMWAWQFAKLQHAADVGGWTRFASMQDQYNLIKREEEREMIPLCADLGVGLVPYSPQGKGRLTRPWGEQTRRSGTDEVARAFDAPDDEAVVDAVQRVAERRELPMALIALAWVLQNPVVSAPVVGATKPHHLADAVAALDVHLTPEETSELEAPYTPQTPFWW